MNRTESTAIIGILLRMRADKSPEPELNPINWITTCAHREIDRNDKYNQRSRHWEMHRIDTELNRRRVVVVNTQPNSEWKIIELK